MAYAAHWLRCWGLVVALGVALSVLVWPVGGVLTMFVMAALSTGVILVVAHPVAGSGSTVVGVRRLRVVTRSLLGGAAVVAICALTDIAAYLSLPVLFLAVASSPWVVHRLERWRRAHGMAAPAAETLSGDEDPSALPPPPSAIRHGAGDLADAELCQAWRQSFLLLQSARSTAGVLSVTSLRQSYLDEMERRHPAAFRSWLDSGGRATGGPDRFLTARRREDHPDAG